jgi:subtilisin family serine protease
VDAAGEYAAFSNIGPQVDVTAPGVGVAAGWSEGAEIVGFSGTSASAPCVAGVIAYVMSQDRSLSATEAAAQVLANADDNGAPDVDDYYGVGLLNAQRSVQAKTPGIHEVAAAGHDVGERTEGGAYPVTVSAQNRGTEVVTSVELTGIVDGKSKTMTFNNVAPGQVVSLVVEVSEQAVAGERPIEVESAVVSPDGQDDWQGNNQRRSILTFREE